MPLKKINCNIFGVNDEFIENSTIEYTISIKNVKFIVNRLIFTLFSAIIYKKTSWGKNVSVTETE